MKKERSRPANPERYARCYDSLRTAFGRGYPPVLLQERCWALLTSYYGSNLATLWHFARQSLVYWYIWHKAGLFMGFSDKMGWTKVTEGQRHGNQCSGSPNCSNLNCIEVALPLWFRRLSGHQHIDT